MDFKASFVIYLKCVLVSLHHTHQFELLLFLALLAVRALDLNFLASVLLNNQLQLLNLYLQLSNDVRTLRMLFVQFRVVLLQFRHLHLESLNLHVQFFQLSFILVLDALNFLSFLDFILVKLNLQLHQFLNPD